MGVEVKKTGQLPEIIKGNLITEIIEELAPEKYHNKRDFISSSGLKTILNRTPLHFQHEWTHHEEDDDSSDGGIKIKTLNSSEQCLRYGSLCHMALLESERFRDKYILEPIFEGYTQDGKLSRQSKEAKLKREDWYSKLPSGKFVVTQDDFESITGTVYSLLGRPDVRGLLDGAKTEVSIFFKHKPTGLKVRVRPDILKVDPKHGIFLTDLKTARDASAYGFSRQVGELLYHVSLALYHDAILEAYGEYPKVSSFLPVEKAPPYACALYPMEENTLLDGRARYESALEILAECLNRDVWPSYQAGAQSLLLQPYHANRPLPLYDFDEWSKK